MVDLGGFNFQDSFPRHGWGDAMSRNFLKMATLFHPAVISRTTPIPSSANDNDAYIDPVSGKLYVWLKGEWHTITPREGALVYVRDAHEYAHYNHHNEWVTAIDLDAVQPPVPRTLSVHVPGLIRPNAIIYRYVAGMEFTIRAGAPGSSAILDTPPDGGSVTFDVQGGNGNGTITFNNGSTIGVFNFPNDVVTLPIEEEGAFGTAQSLIIRSPEDVHGAQGLTVTFRGEVRPIHEG